MTTFIPFDPSGDNPKQISSEVFSVGQEIKVKATGTLAGAVYSPMIKESDPVTIQASSATAPSAQFTGTWDELRTTVTNLTAVADSGDLLDDLTATGSSADKFFANSNSSGGLRLQDVSPYLPISTTTLEVVAALTSAPGTTVTGSPLLYDEPQGSNNQKFLYLTASSFVDIASLAGISDGTSITLTVTRTVE